jgi:beta-phosphoglucomutase-like phosphatase (HAD superfamily)
MADPRTGEAHASEPAAFVLGVDLDGVCADYTSAFRRALARHRGTSEESLPPEATWDYREWGLDRDSFLDHHRRAVVEDRLFATMPAMDGVADALWRLSDAGVWIRIITHRLVENWSHEAVVSDTVAWLDDQRVPYRDLCFMGDKPQVGADAYVEDAPHNIEALRASGCTVIVFDQPYNRHLGGARAHTWIEVEAQVVDLVAAHRGSVEVPLPGFGGGTERLEHRRRNR